MAEEKADDVGEISVKSCKKTIVSRYLKPHVVSCHDSCKYVKRRENQSEKKPWKPVGRRIDKSPAATNEGGDFLLRATVSGAKNCKKNVKPSPVVKSPERKINSESSDMKMDAKKKMHTQPRRKNASSSGEKTMPPFPLPANPRRGSLAKRSSAEAKQGEKVPEKVLHVIKMTEAVEFVPQQADEIIISSDSEATETVDGEEIMNPKRERKFSKDVHNSSEELKFMASDDDDDDDNTPPRRLSLLREAARTTEDGGKKDVGGPLIISSEKVVLRRQDVQGKKDSRVLLNKVIEETASKLVETRKSKVKALVGAFETVISLHETDY